MGITVLNIEVANVAEPEKSRSIEFIVDSGAIPSVVPSEILDELGIKPIAVHELRLADGCKIQRKKGVALFRYEEQVGGADVIFGEPGDHKLLGAFTLAALGLGLDPFKREL